MKIKSSPWVEILKITLGLAVSAGAVYLILALVDLDGVVAAVREVEYLRLVPFLLLVLISYGARAASWRTILPGSLPYGKVFLTMHAGYLINTLLPFRMGEIGRALMLKTPERDFWEIIPTIVLERFFDLSFALALFFSSLPFVFGVKIRGDLVLLMVSLVGLTFFVMWLVYRRRRTVLSWVEGRGDQGRIRKWIRAKLGAFLSGLEILSHPGDFFAALGWMALTWALALLSQYLLLRAVVGEARLLWVTFSLGAVALGAAVPSSPGNLGVYEASLLGALLAFGIDRSQALTYAILSHALNIGVTAFFGSLALIQEGISVRSVWTYRGKSREEGSQ